MSERARGVPGSQIDDEELYFPPNTVREMLARYDPQYAGWIVESAEGSLTPFDASRAEMDTLRRQLASLVMQWEAEGFNPTADLL